MVLGFKTFRGWPAVAVCLVSMFMGAPLSAAPLQLNDRIFNGPYIGRHVEYLSEGEVFASISQRWRVPDMFKGKMLSGELHSDKDITFQLKQVSDGYLAELKSKGDVGTSATVSWGVNDLMGEHMDDRFVQSKTNVFHLDFTPHSYWLKFQIQNHRTAVRNLVLELDKHTFQSMDMFLPLEKGFMAKRGNFIQPLMDRESGFQNFAFEFTAHPGLNTYYLRIDSWFTDVVPLRIWSREGFQKHKIIKNTLLGIVSGIFICLFFFNILLYLFVRDPSYIYLSMMTACGLLLHIASSGFGFQFLWPENPLFGFYAIALGFPLSFAFFFFFCRSFMDIPRYSPGMDKVIRVLAILSLIMASGPFLLPLDFQKRFLGLVLALDCVYYLPVLYPVIWAIRQKNRSGIFLLIGILFYLLSNLEWALSSLDIIPYHLIDYIHFKGAGFLIIMTLGLADKINVMKNTLVEMNVNLEEKVAERTGDLLGKTTALELANEQLKELDKTKTRFFANISHELRTPLALISAPLESFCQGEYGRMTKSNQYIFESMKRNADRLLRLINDLLDFSKIEARKMKLKRNACDISVLMSYCVSSITSAAAGKGIETKFIDRTDGLIARIDRDLVEKAVFNLLSNAIKFNQSGGSIILLLEVQGPHFSIRVKDTGMGIPEDMHEAIFERFNQVDNSSTRGHEGTGIGLSLTREIVHMHGGEITVLSREGEGSEFTITLPKNAGNETPLGDASEHYDDALCPGIPWENRTPRHPPSTKADTTRPGRDTILIVEDNADMRGYLQTMLEKNYGTLTADNGKTALDILKGHGVDLILADLMMPEMDGYDFIKTVRASKAYGALPIIILTAKSQIPDKVEGMDMGANDYLIKPFSPRELSARIRSQLKFRPLREAYLKSGRAKKSITDTTRRKIEIVKQFLNENFTEEISRDGLAKAVGMSPDHLGRMFKQHTGNKISEHLNGKRIEAACRELRETDRKIIDIAFGVGFESLRTFNKTFLESTGMNPSNYRKQAPSSRIP